MVWLDIPVSSVLELTCTTDCVSSLVNDVLVYSEFVTVSHCELARSHVRMQHMLSWFDNESLADDNEVEDMKETELQG